ncbi:eIF-2-alpha kinase activator GCN1-like [Drosophila gunungcola]|uniref:eIF-2-alpha kinase activator GCN1-like n=1 Tax=Drosophila gunungcola TaxID=103775 RepID=UPI0022E16B55|nr:eIF-2-alpha kinase activator GCN1-like [Drosophila gunungcola]
MGRSDVSLMVRQAALHVWKVVMTNTPRTLREILPTLFGLLPGCLASTSYDKRQVAARTLGDLVRKLGERVLPEIIPILENGLNSDQPDQREGVCIGLSEIMGSTSKEMVLTFVHSLIPTVRKALCDPLPEVREAAAKTFESLHSTVGARALDDILPFMLEGLSDPDPCIAENILDGLRQVMSIKSRVVLPYLVPQLTSQPVNTKALSILVSVAGEALTKYLPKILSALLEALSGAYGSPHELQEIDYCQTVILSVTDETGIRTVMDTLLISANSSNLCTRKFSASLLSAFCIHSPGNYSQYIPQLLRSLLKLLVDNDKDILQKSWEALNAVIKGLNVAQQISHFSDLAAPLNQLRRKDVAFFFGPQQQQAFTALKSHIINATQLAHFDEKLPLVLATDASSFGIGVVLSHLQPDGGERPIVFASKTLDKHQVKYSQIEKEGLSITFGVKRFHQYLYGRKFILITDHKPIDSHLLMVMQMLFHASQWVQIQTSTKNRKLATM